MPSGQHPNKQPGSASCSERDSESDHGKIHDVRRGVRQAFVQGISTRAVDDLVKALGMSGVSKSQVSRLCELTPRSWTNFKGSVHF
jgi:hypothetical protein